MLYFTWIHFFCVYTSYLACIGLLVVGSVGPVETVYANSLLTDVFLVFSSSCLGFSFPFFSPLTRQAHLQRAKRTPAVVQPSSRMTRATAPKAAARANSAPPSPNASDL